MWSWEHIKKHRDTCRKYKEAYKKKLTSKKIAKDLQETLDVSFLWLFCEIFILFYLMQSCEKELSVFNITLCRQYAEVEVMRLVKPTLYWYAWLAFIAVWCYLINIIHWEVGSHPHTYTRSISYVSCLCPSHFSALFSSMHFFIFDNILTYEYSLTLCVLFLFLLPSLCRKEWFWGKWGN
jgi:hypothetical protein